MAVTNEMDATWGYLRFCWSFLQPGKIEGYQKTAKSRLSSNQLLHDKLEEAKGIRNVLYLVTAITSMVALGVLFSLPGSFIVTLGGMAVMLNLGLLFCECMQPIYHQRNTLEGLVFRGVHSIHRKISATNRQLHNNGVHWFRL